MQIKEIVDKVRPLDICEEREYSEGYAELVFYKKDAPQWQEVFSGLLGSPAKPPAARPTGEDVRLTENYGGIRKNQTLYKKDFDGYSIIAMLWPWQDDTHITLKLACLKK